jgi:hypothetical protein
MDAETTAALSAALAYDPALPDEPERLGRALTDLLPFDERAVRLLTVAATAGVPALLTAGLTGEAKNRLIDQFGLRADVAAEMVDTWLAASGRTGADVSSPAPGVAALVGEFPGAPTAVSVGAGPAAGALVGLVTAGGVFAGLVVDGAAQGWRRVASPTAPTSRDVAVVSHEDERYVVWTSSDGVFARGVTGTAGVPALGEPRLVARPGTGQPRYPLAAVSDDAGSVDVLWTSDRVAVVHNVLRDWAGSPTTDVPAAPSTARFTGLAADYAGGRTAWLAALLDDGTALVARWDLALRSIGAWTRIQPPVALGAITVAAGLGGTAAVLAFTTTGHLLAIDAEAAVARQDGWHSVDPPAGVPRASTAPRALAAAGGEPGWLLFAGETGTWLAHLRRENGLPTLGSGHLLDLGTI